MAIVGGWFATWIQDACSFDMSPTCHRAAIHPKQPSAISSCATHTDQSMPSCCGLSEHLSIPATHNRTTSIPERECRVTTQTLHEDS